MSNNTDYPACSFKRLFILIALSVGFILSFIFLIYEPYYEVTLNGEFVGYYKNYEDFQHHCEEVSQQTFYNNDLEIKKYCTIEPTFKKVLIKEKHIKNFNNCTLIAKQCEEEYILYSIKVNNEIKFYTKTNEKAEELVNEIKKQVKESTEIIIEKIYTKDINLLNTEEHVAQTKQEVIERNLKTTYRGGGERVNNPNSKYIWPTTQRNITSYFGARWGRNHNGIDVGIPLNTKIFSIDDGTVIYSGWNGGYGYQVKIQHNNGIITTYAHCNKLLVSKGQKVTQGEVIARSGSTGNSTGPHLHFEFILNGSFKNPLNYL